MLFTAPLPHIWIPELFVKLSRTVIFTCAVEQIRGTVYYLHFHNVKYAVALMSFHQNMGRCSVFSAPPRGYTSSCGRGTGNSASDMKEYTLKIHKLGKTDLTNWWCRVGNTSSNIFTLGLKCKLSIFVTTFSIPLYF